MPDLYRLTPEAVEFIIILFNFFFFLKNFIKYPRLFSMYSIDFLLIKQENCNDGENILNLPNSRKKLRNHTYVHIQPP